MADETTGPGYRLICGDCLAVLPGLRGINAVVTDPPYGINLNANYLATRFDSQRRDGRRHAWMSKGHGPIIGDDRPFDPSHLLSFPTLLLWGANAYSDRLPASYSWLVWDKKDGRGAQNSFSDCELCWCQGVPFNSVRIYSHLWTGYQRDSEIGEGSLHPTQKPVRLMAWCMEKAGIPRGATVLDPYMGSGSTGVACILTGRNFIGIEIDPTHFQTASRRIADAAAQPRLIPHVDLTPVPVQAELVCG